MDLESQISFGEDTFLEEMDEKNLLNLIMEKIPDSIYIKDKQSRFVKIDRAQARIIGVVNPDDAIGKTDFDFFTPEHARTAYEDEQRIIRTGEPLVDKLEKIRRSDGEYRWVSATKIPIRNVNGGVIGIIGISHDVTDLKIVQDQLKKSEKRYETLLSVATDYVYTVKRGEDGSFITNHGLGCEAVTGYSPKEYEKDPDLWFKMIHKDDQEFVTNQISRLMSGESIPPFEHRLVHKNGSIKWVRNTFVVRTDEHGNLLSYDGLVTDITEPKKIQEKMKIKDSAIDSSINGIVITDMSGNIVYVNDAFLEMWNYDSQSELIGQPLVKYWSTKGKAVDIMDSLIDKGSWFGELEAERKDKSTFFTQLSATTVRNDGGTPICMMASFVDITKRKEAEEKIKQSERAKTEFMNVAAHELKTPIIPIKGYLEMLWDAGDLDKKRKEWINICLRNTNNLLFLINDILDVARLESDNLKIVKEKADINKIIKDVIKDMKPVFKDKKLDLKSDLEKKNIKVDVDIKRIQQVLRNLLNNSYKCTDKGKIIISTRKKTDEIIVSIKDTGMGIDRNNLSKLFKKFSQLDGVETRKVEGTGLGLYICRGIIEKHGGKIWAESPGVGKGSTFRFSIPLN